MSTAMKNAEAIIRLDEARNNLLSLLSPLGALHQTMQILLQRIQEAWDRIPEEGRAAFTEQVEKTLALDAALRDFRDYMSEPRAWCPAKEDL